MTDLEEIDLLPVREGSVRRIRNGRKQWIALGKRRGSNLRLALGGAKTNKRPITLAGGTRK